MTKSRFFKEIDNSIQMTCAENLDFCQACTYVVGNNYGQYFVLQSYSTRVAAYSYATDTLYVRDRYSATTDKHVSKFVNRVNPGKIVYLYQRSNRLIVVNSNGTSIKGNKVIFNDAYNTDWAEFIPEMENIQP